MLGLWLRVMRLKFLLASVIAVSIGLALSWVNGGHFTLTDAILTLAGILALHISVDLFNDYWDYKRGIDSNTTSTGMSGGTGTVGDGKLVPSHVFAAAIIFMILGCIAGIYFIITSGYVIGILLGFAVLSVYFYSTKIINAGLAEIFVAIKGTMIVLGTFFIQTGNLSVESLLGGVIAGSLSSLVLFVTSYPDYHADKAGGRRTLVIILGRQKASNLFWIFMGVAYSALLIGVILDLFPSSSLIMLLCIPLGIYAGTTLSKHHSSDTSQMLSFMSRTILFSRISGILFVSGILLFEIIH